MNERTFPARGVALALLMAVVFLVSGPGMVTASEVTVAEPAVSQEPPHEAAAPEHAGEAGASTAEAGQEHAVDGEEDHGEEHAGPTWTDYVYKWINFFMLVGIMYWLLVVPPNFVVENFEYPGLRVILAARSAAIVQARDLARDQKLDAARGLQESEERFAQVEGESEALLAEARVDAARERERIEGRAIEEAALIRDSADRDMDAGVNRARRALQGHVADLAIGIASRLVRENVSDQDQDRLVREYLDNLGETVG